MSVDVDPIAALRGLLLADADVASLVGSRVFGGELPPADAKAMPREAIVITPAGGGLLGRAYQDYGDVRIDVVCYGETLNEAWGVYLAAKTVLRKLNRRTVDGVLLHWARPSSKGALARDPEKQWPTCYSSWQVLVGDIAAA